MSNNEFAITFDDLNDFLEKNGLLLLFDLRLKNLYEWSHIEGSVHDVCNVNAQETIMPQIPKNVKIVLVVDDGKMSSETVTMMCAFGLDVYFLQGGIKEWKKGLVSGSAPVTIVK